MVLLDARASEPPRGKAESAESAESAEKTAYTGREDTAYSGRPVVITCVSKLESGEVTPTGQSIDGRQGHSNRTYHQAQKTTTCNSQKPNHQFIGRRCIVS
ncbi:hypothetical protein Pst134EB_003856 [Puccinia striiformis f. sp. tritici]|nr:hypothetical protein Pst134EB_003856 [Puccinia striiformis f. sp. tritici]